MSPEPVHKVSKLTDNVSPFVLKVIADSSEKYRKAYKSYAFGIASKLAGKWLWFVVGGIMALIVILFLTGNLPGVG